MLVVQVDRVDAEPPLARLTGRSNVLGIAAYSEEFAVRAADVTKLGRDEDLVSPVADCLADQFLVPPHAVHICRIEEVDAAFDGVVDRGDGFGFAATAVEFAHSHAAEADGRDFGPVPA